MVIPSHQSEKLSQLQTMLEAGRAESLPVADRLELRWLVDALCHGSKVTDKPLVEKSRVDAAVAVAASPKSAKHITVARRLATKRLAATC